MSNNELPRVDTALMNAGPKPHEQLNPIELAFEVGKEWINKGERTTSRLQLLTASAIWFEREQCARMAERHGAPAIARSIRQDRPGGMPTPKPISRLILPPGFDRG